MTTLAEERMSAIHLLRAGERVPEVAQQLDHTEQWVRKWWRRYVRDGWAGVVERSRAPRRVPRRLPDEVKRQIILVRSELEAEAVSGKGLKYIGSRAVRTRLKAQGCKPLPSITSIERVLRDAGMTKPRRKVEKPEVIYPHVRPTRPLQLIQVDIVPHYLTGGTRIPCFNGIDVVSRCAAGMAYEGRRSADAGDFHILLWQVLGIPEYNQVDNDGCFDGGHTHPYVIGHVARLALYVGTELIFSPVYHPESNGYVERFHQEYNRHVWDDTYFSDIAAVKEESNRFFALYCDSSHHSALNGRTPQEVHGEPPYRLPSGFTPPPGRLSLYEGRLHFIRQVRPDGTVSVLNVSWAVPNPNTLQGVWVTVELRTNGATLSIYDAAPDVPTRRCLVTYLFPLNESVLSRAEITIGRPAVFSSQSTLTTAQSSSRPIPQRLAIPVAEGVGSLLHALFGTVRRTIQFATETMY